MTQSIRLQKSHPWRPPDWRYRKARACLENDQPLSRVRDDSETNELYSFLRRLRTCRDEQAEADLFRECGGPWLAVEIHQNPAMRAIVEARLLANESSESIGFKIGFKNVNRYAEYFFDVQDRLQFQDFIYSEVLCAARHNSTAGGAHGLDLRRVGYFGGVDAIDTLTQGSAVQVDSSTSAFSQAKIRQYVSHVLTRKCVSAIDRMDPSDEKSVGHMLKLYAQFNEAQNLGQTPGQVRYLENALAMMKEIPWGCGPTGIPAELGPWTETAVELRAAEQLQIARNKNYRIPNELKDLSLREEQPRP